MKSKMNGNVLTLYVTGEIDHNNARRIRETADGLIHQKHPSLLNMDFSGVSFMDSSGIGLIMGRYRTMQLYGGKLRVTEIPVELRRMMELSGLSGLDVLDVPECVSDDKQGIIQR